MDVIANEDVTEFVQDLGGRLFVWADPHRCCRGGVTLLRASARAPGTREFRQHDVDGFELWFDPGRKSPPDELHLEVKGWRKKRVEAYWNGCVLVT